MTNAEKYLKDGVDIKQFAEMIDTAYIKADSDADVCESTINWLKEQATPTLTEDERVILKNICFTPLKDFYIERRHGTLKLHNRVDELYDFFAYDHLFQFVKERRRILY